jgi:hypothetical protein
VKQKLTSTEPATKGRHGAAPATADGADRVVGTEAGDYRLPLPNGRDEEERMARAKRKR